MGRRRSVLGAVVASVALVGVSVSLTPSAGAGERRFTGDPIKIMVVGPFDVPTAGTSTPEQPGAVEARAEAINDAGGLEDASGETHEVEVIVCDTQFDPNKAGDCAREAVEEGVVAVTGATIGPQEEAQFFPIIDEARIPVIGPIIGGPLAGTSPMSFAFANPIGTLIGTPELLAAEGATKVAALITEALGPAGAFYEQGVELSGVEAGETVLVPVDQTDVAPNVTAALQGDPDAVSVVLSDSQLIPSINLLRQDAPDASVASLSSFLTTDVIDDLGDSANGVYVALSATPVTAKTPGAKMYRKDMKAFDKGLPRSDYSLLFWTSAWVFERVAETLPEITSASVLEAMGQLEDFDMGGIEPPLTTTEPVQIEGIPFTRLFNPYITWGVVKKGKIVAVDDVFHDPFTGEPGPSFEGREGKERARGRRR